MAFFDFLKRDKQVEPKTDTIGLSPILMDTGKPHPSEEMLRELTGGDPLSLDYIKIAKISRLIVQVFPPAKRAISIMTDMVGRPCFVNPGGESDAMSERANSLLEFLPILSEFDWITPREFGADNLVGHTVRRILIDGMAFLEDRYEDERISNYQGCLLYDPLAFRFEKTNQFEPSRLVYRSEQYPEVGDFFRFCGYEYSPESPWARPLLYGGGFFTEVMISLLVAIRNMAQRKGAPLELMMVSLQDDSVLRDDKSKQAYLKGMESLESSLKLGAKRQLMGGKAQAIVSKVPAKVDLLSRHFGSEISNEVDADLLMLVLVSFSSILEIPVEFLGYVLGGGGLNSERFEILSDIWKTKIERIRDQIRPAIYSAVESHLMAEGFPLAALSRMDMKFENMEHPNRTKDAEAAKVEAETAEIWTRIAEVMNQVDTNLGREVLERYVNV